MRARALARGEGDELDAAVGVERVDEGLGERAEAPDERLPALEVREALGDGTGCEFGIGW